MNFEDSTEEAAFRAEVRAWLDRHARPLSTAAPTALQALSDTEALAEARVLSLIHI